MAGSSPSNDMPSLGRSEEHDSDWSDISSEDGKDEGERSLKIDLREDEEPEKSVPAKSPSRRHSTISLTATSGSSKKSRL